MASQLAAWLSGPLATSQSLLATLPSCLQQLTLDLLVIRAEEQAADSVLSRWCQCISTLLNSSRDASERSSGLELALETVKQSENIFLSQRAWTIAALDTLKNTSASSKTHSTALLFTAHALEAAQRLPEFSRDIFKPETLKQIASDASNIALNASVILQVRILALELSCRILELHATTLRPIVQPSATEKKSAGTSLQVTALTLLLDETLDEALIFAAARLFARLWLAAGKKEGPERYQQTVEALCGSWHAVISTVTRTFHDANDSALPAPLNLTAMRPATSSNAHEAVGIASKRMRSFEIMLKALLSYAIDVNMTLTLKLLSVPTDHPISVPLGVLVHLLLRCFALTENGKARDVADHSMRAAELSVLPEIHLAACRLSVQLASIFGSQMSLHMPHLLNHLCHAIDSYPSNACVFDKILTTSRTLARPVRSALLATSTILLELVGVGPGSSHHLSKVLKPLLSDLSAIAASDTKPAKTVVNGTDSKRKAKRARYEVDQNFARRAPLGASKLAIANNALPSIERILRSSASAFVPGSELGHCLRLLLAILSRPTFHTSRSPLLVLNTDALTFALATYPIVKPAILRCLVAAIPLASRDSAEVLERALPSFRALLSDGNAEVRIIAFQIMGLVDLSLHPRVPPTMTHEAWESATKERFRAAALQLPGNEEGADGALEVEGDETTEAAQPIYQEPPQRQPPPPQPIFHIPAPEPLVEPVPSAQLAADPETDAHMAIEDETTPSFSQQPASMAWSSAVPFVEYNDNDVEEDDDAPLPTIDPRSSSDEEEVE